MQARCYNQVMIRPTVEAVERMALQLPPQERSELMLRLSRSLGDTSNANLDLSFSEMDRIREGSRLDGVPLRSLIEEGRR